MKALAIFHDHGSAAICRFLKPGFRHCFVCLAADDAWILFDPRAGVPVLEVVANVDFDLAGFYQSRGFTVVETIRRNTEGGFPLMVATCVGVAKRMLGIRSPLVQTPWRLYRHLTEKKGRDRRTRGAHSLCPRQGNVHWLRFDSRGPILVETTVISANRSYGR